VLIVDLAGIERAFGPLFITVPAVVYCVIE